MDQNNETMTPTSDVESEARRDFLRKLGKASATAPAVGLLLAASFKSERALGYESGGGGSGGGTDAAYCDANPNDPACGCGSS